jgi:hypothetical protein
MKHQIHHQYNHENKIQKMFVKIKIQIFMNNMN